MMMTVMCGHGRAAVSHRPKYYTLMRYLCIIININIDRGGKKFVMNVMSDSTCI